MEQTHVSQGDYEDDDKDKNDYHGKYLHSGFWTAWRFTSCPLPIQTDGIVLKKDFVAARCCMTMFPVSCVSCLLLCVLCLVQKRNFVVNRFLLACVSHTLCSCLFKSMLMFPSLSTALALFSFSFQFLYFCFSFDF